MRLPSGAAASASGAFARPGSTGAPCDQRAPPSLVAVIDENVRAWLGRKPVTRECGPGVATTRPPLSATATGVTSFQLAAGADRANSCQKLFCCALDPPISTTAQLRPVLAENEVLSGGGLAAGAAASAAPPLPCELPQPASSSAAAVTAAAAPAR